MDLKGVFGAKWFALLVNVLWLVSSGLVLFILNKIDGIVHGDLYNYGLQFSLDWATNYWLFMRFIVVFMAIPAVLSFVTVVFGVLSGREVEVKRVASKPKAKLSTSTKAVAEDSNRMLISCPHCHKLFSKPLVMLDFTGRKSRLVSVCPYCNRKLTDTNNRGSDVSTRVLDSEEEVVEE